MAKIKQKERALEYRHSGKSIKEISTLLCVSQSTVSVWCRDISLDEEAIAKIARLGKEKSVRGLMRYSEKRRIQRQLDETASAKKGILALGTLSERDIYCIGLGLYWGEGYKTGSQEFGFTNSDPSMILFYIKWLKVVFKVKKQDLILRISINETHKKRGDIITTYWSRLTGVSKDQFTKTSFIKTSSRKVYKNESTHMGTLRIKVRRGTSFRREVIGAIRGIN